MSFMYPVQNILRVILIHVLGQQHKIVEFRAIRPKWTYLKVYFFLLFNYLDSAIAGGPRSPQEVSCELHVRSIFFLTLALLLLHRCIGANYFIAVNILWQDSANELITDVCVQDEELWEVWTGENVWNNQTPSQCIKWVSAVFKLIVLSIGPYCLQRTNKIRKSRHKFVVTTEALELSEIWSIGRKGR